MKTRGFPACLPITGRQFKRLYVVTFTIESNDLIDKQIEVTN